ncbi:serine/threonine-protein phosphatase 6 regulatory ankyrin repeat subunit B-like [Macrobrachium nipponense]|uniref:serine/threonine-protein phosphatase 6 regulatory ankyrin repeat subunit B-like n=1 Tax=Macrobrachium nipponense TaxID=159736 RepID=UPI0030C8AAF4
MGAHDAALGGKCDVITVLLESGFDVNCKNKKGNTMLHLAALKGHRELVQLLISKGANVNDKGNMGRTPIHRAVESNDVSIVQELIESAHDAAIDVERDAITVLLESGFDVNCKNKEGSTMLHLAAGNGHRELVQLLISKGAKVNDKDNGRSHTH